MTYTANMTDQEKTCIEHISKVLDAGGDGVFTRRSFKLDNLPKFVVDSVIAHFKDDTRVKTIYSHTFGYDHHRDNQIVVARER